MNTQVVDAGAARLGVSAARRPGVVLVPWMVAGVQSQFEQMRHLPGLADARVIEVRPHRPGGIVERLPLPGTMRGTIRSTMAAARSLPMRGVQTVWTQVALPMLPFALARAGRGVSVYYAIDCTPVLLHRFGEHYGGVDTPDSPQGRLTGACLRLFFARCTGLLPWSDWAARSMVDDYGASPERVHVIAPGVDLERWTPAPRPLNNRPRLLFVGADFDRKGGRLLLDVFRSSLRDLCELDLVTREAVAPEPGVRVWNGLTVDDPRLRALYRDADALVLPTFADCFSMAALEAMACGLPVVISAVGGIPEIVVEGETGFLIAPGDREALLRAVCSLVASPELRTRMGAAGRARAERCFDAGKQAAATLRVMLGGYGA